MPTSTIVEVPPKLWALIHDLLNTAGLSKVAKSLVKRVDAELPSTEGMESLVSIFKKYHADSCDSKKRKTPDESSADSEVQEGKKKKKSASKQDLKKVEAEPAEEEEAVKKPTEKEGKKKSKKGKVAEAEEEAPTPDSPASNPPSTSDVNGSAKKGASSSSPFQRVKAEEVTYLKVKGGRTEADRLKNNTFESKGGDEFGAKASEILVSVRGKDFRHEKTKKKRSFRSSGPIDMNSNSIKFDSDSE